MTRNAPYAWDKASDRRLSELWGQMTAATIAERLGNGATPAAIGKRAKALGLPRLRADYSDAVWTDAEEATLRQMWNEGEPRRLIAKATGHTPNAVSAKAQRLGLPTRPHGGFRGQRSGLVLSGLNPNATGGDPKPPSGLVTKPHPHPDGGDPVTFEALEPRMCKFEVTGAAVADGMRFCGARRKPGKPYCDHHAGVAHQKPTGRVGQVDPKIKAALDRAFGGR